MLKISYQACNHPCLVSKDYKADMDAVDPKAAKSGTQDPGADGDDLVAAFGQLTVVRKCQVCMTECVLLSFIVVFLRLTSKFARDHRLAPTNSATFCDDCAPLAKAAQIQRPESAKIRMILELLHAIDERSGGTEKTIIFSQFTSMLDLIEPFLSENQIKFVRCESFIFLLCCCAGLVDGYFCPDDGSMNTVEREASLKKIRESGHTRVILISFKAGSTGALTVPLLCISPDNRRLCRPQSHSVQ